MKLLLIHALLTAMALPGLRAELAVDIDFPGGSGEVVSFDQQNHTIVLNPSDHPDRGWRCWWYVRLTGITPNTPVTLDVGEAPWATPNHATFSIDDGKTWQHTEAGQRDGKRIRYSLIVDVESALVAWGPPFVPADAAALVEDLAEASPLARAFSLCTTREGRDTPALAVGDAGHPLIWIQARQHAWESGASWVGKGFAEWLVSDTPKAAHLRNHYHTVVVPIMDIDNVHRGAGGKNQEPQDHNRDWSDAPHWRSVAAAQAEMRAAAEAGRLALFVDLHNPAASNLFPYFYLPPADSLSEDARAQQARFLDAAKAEITGPLRYTGKTIETGAQYDARAWQRISKNWVARLGTHAPAVTLEVAWNTPASTTSGYLTVGRQLGQAIARYLEPDDGETPPR